MSTQQRVADPVREDPDEVVARARAEHKPVATWCLFSGGNDSTVLAHRCREHYDGLAFIDTGTAVPGVAEFVTEFAEWIGKPLRVLHAGDAFRSSCSAATCARTAPSNRGSDSRDRRCTRAPTKL